MCSGGKFATCYYYHIYPAIRRGFCPSRMTSNNEISPMKFCYNTNFTLPKQSQRSRSILKDGSWSLGLFWKEKTLSYNRRNTVILNPASSYRIACLIALCPSLKKFYRKTLKCDAHAIAKADINNRVTTIALWTFIQESLKVRKLDIQARKNASVDVKE